MRRPRIRDDLTSLPLRATLSYDFERLQAARPLSLLLCDLDHLKLVNDTLGHLAGDQALQTLAAALQAHLKPGWGAYRFGGDEFAVLAPVDAPALKDWADQLLISLAQAAQPAAASALAAALPRCPPPRPSPPWWPRPISAFMRPNGAAKPRSFSLTRPAALNSRRTRLLDREDAFTQATALLVSAQHRPAEIEVQALPGSGLSAFLEQLGVVARTLGYQTLRLCGNQARQCQHLGAWAYASLDSRPPAPLDPGEFRARQPLWRCCSTPRSALMLAAWPP